MILASHESGFLFPWDMARAMVVTGLVAMAGYAWRIARVWRHLTRHSDTFKTDLIHPVVLLGLSYLAACTLGAVYMLNRLGHEPNLYLPVYAVVFVCGVTGFRSVLYYLKVRELRARKMKRRATDTID